MALRFLSARSPDLLGQPAAHMMRRARFLAHHAPTTVEQHVPRPSRRRRAAHDSRPAAAQKEPEQYPLTQAVDFSQGAIEPDNLLTRQDRELLGAEIRQRRVQQILREHRHHMGQKSIQLRNPFPGAWNTIRLRQSL